VKIREPIQVFFKKKLRIVIKTHNFLSHIVDHFGSGHHIRKKFFKIEAGEKKNLWSTIS